MKWNDIKDLSEDDLIEHFDKTSTYEGKAFYRDEIMRRSNERTNQEMLNYTKQIKRMTLLMLIFTFISVICTIFVLTK